MPMNLVDHMITLVEKVDERTGTALAIARRGGRCEAEPRRALAGRGGRPHRLAEAMVCVVSNQQSGYSATELKHSMKKGDF
jgi:hypothetical protein